MMKEYEKIKQIIINAGYAEYRYKQVLEAVFQQRKLYFKDMHTLPKALRILLQKSYGDTVCSIKPIVKKKSKQVEKVLFSITKDCYIETVHMYYKKGWESFCVSSQSGCGFGCQFCATGTIGFKNNLSAKQITDQLLYFYLKGNNLHSVSFMAMGEPLANPAIFDALRSITDDEFFNISQRKITISTIGILPSLKRLIKEYPQINITYSFHSPFEKQRSMLMPINKIYPLHQVLPVLGEHINKTKRKVYLAYILIKDVNDSIRHVEEIIKLVHAYTKYPYLFHLDLIGYNASDIIGKHFIAPTKKEIQEFYELLKEKGISVTIRTQFGTDIQAACGQLYGDYI